MSGSDAEEIRAALRLQPVLRVVTTEGNRSVPPGSRLSTDAAAAQPDPAAELVDAIDRAAVRAGAIADRAEQLRAELARARLEWPERESRSLSVPRPDLLLRAGVLLLLVCVAGLALWARAVNYALRVTSDAPTFIALVAGMAERPFAEQSPFLDGDFATQHATPYTQALALVWRALGDGVSAEQLGGFLALAGIVVYGFTLVCFHLYVRRLAGATAAWVALPVLLGVFGPPHVIWASDLSLHAALYAGFFPQNVAMGTLLVALLLLERESRASLIAVSIVAGLTMLVHPFTGVLLCVLVTAHSCRLSVRRDSAFVRGPIALGAGFGLGLLWPAYSLDRAFAETGLRGVVFVGLCVALPFVAALLARRSGGPRVPVSVGAAVAWLDAPRTVFRLALVGAAGTLVVAVWELVLVMSPPEESARLAIYWVDDRWRWPLMLSAGVVGIAGLARLAARGRIVPAVWFVGCFGLGALGALGLPFPVWYRFLLLCQVPLAIGVAVVIAESRRWRTVAVVAATFALALMVKIGTLVWAPPNVSYFGQSLQPAWSIGEHIEPGEGLVATDPATAYFVPSTTGRRVLTVDKGHVSSRAELAASAEGYELLRRFYSGGEGWWDAAQEMWRRGVRYVVVAKHTTLEPETLHDFIWQTARLRTDEQRLALGTYFYANNRVGTLVHDSPDFAIYRFEERKLFPGGSTP
jgi:hypothetical protein